MMDNSMKFMEQEDNQMNLQTEAMPFTNGEVTREVDSNKRPKTARGIGWFLKNTLIILFVPSIFFAMSIGLSDGYRLIDGMTRLMWLIGLIIPIVIILNGARSLLSVALSKERDVKWGKSTYMLINVVGMVSLIGTFAAIYGLLGVAH